MLRARKMGRLSTQLTFGLASLRISFSSLSRVDVCSVCEGGLLRKPPLKRVRANYAPCNHLCVIRPCAQTEGPRVPARSAFGTVQGRIPRVSEFLYA